ncbi:MAG: nucleotidyltransferase family protein [Fermentimonas sp.]|jgi:NDP-sugar pyrophosphorylase family protein
MKAMVFAAGLGTRLKPLTDSMPKALVPVAGKPLLQHTIEKLKASGFNEVIINVHHFANQIIDFMRRNDNFGIRIEFSNESEKLLDTGGGIKRASWFFNDGQPFLIHNVDILSNIDLCELMKQHRESNSAATLVCGERETSRYLLFDRSNRLRGWVNEKTGEEKSPVAHRNPSRYKKLAFSGIHLLQPSLFKQMEEMADTFSIIDFYIQHCDEVAITLYAPKGLQTIDVGRLEALPAAELFVNQLTLISPK